MKLRRPDIRTTDLIPSIPVLLLCAATLVVLLLDIVSSGMADGQYIVYPLLIRIVSLISICCTAALLRTVPDESRIHIAACTVFFALFILFVIISTCVNGITRDSVLGVRYRYLGVTDFIIMTAAYMYCSRSINSDKLRDAVLMAYMLLADLIAVVFISDWNFQYIDAFRDKNEPAAIFFHGNHYGYFIVMAVAIAAGYCLYGTARRPLAGVLSLLLQLSALALNRSMGCMIAAAFAVTALLLTALSGRKVSGKRFLLVIAPFIIILILILLYGMAFKDDFKLLVEEAVEILSGGGTEYAGHGRWGLWKETGALIAARPLTGYGCEGISETLFDSFAISNPHNEVMTYAAFFGIPAAICYTAGVLATLAKGFQSRNSFAKTAAFAALGYFISSMFGVAMFYTAPFFFCFLGLAACEENDN